MKPSNERLANIVKKAESESLKNIENTKAKIKPILNQIRKKLDEITEILDMCNCYSVELEELEDKIYELDESFFNFDLHDDIKNKQTKWQPEIPFGQ